MLVSAESEKTWKEKMIAHLRHYLGMCLQELKKATKNLSLYIWCPSGDSNQVLSE
jgi:hypothetical protein